MTDIIVIPPSVFRRESNSVSLKETIPRKYEDIFKKYACFTTPNLAPTHAKYENTRQRYVHGNHTRRPDQNVRKTKDPIKILLGILNIINKSNYTKMLNKLRLIKSDENVGIMIDEILRMASLQTFYIDIFTRLLHDFHGLCNDSEKSHMRNSLYNFTNGFITGREWIQSKAGSSTHESEYSMFCNMQKSKSLIHGKNVVLIELVKGGYIAYDPSVYFEMLTTDLGETITQKNDECFSIIIGMLHHIAKSKNIPKLQLHIPSLLDNVSSKKMAFSLEELQDIMSTT